NGRDNPPAGIEPMFETAYWDLEMAGPSSNPKRPWDFAKLFLGKICPKLLRHTTAGLVDDEGINEVLARAVPLISALPGSKDTDFDQAGLHLSPTPSALAVLRAGRENSVPTADPARPNQRLSAGR